MKKIDRKLPIVEIFRSFQGESFNTGRDAIFVRTTGCNLSCVFADGALCDTPYQQASEKLTLDEVMDRARELMGGLLPAARDFGSYGEPNAPDDRPMLVITGGEPTIQPTFNALVERARDARFYVAVETNGTTWKEGLAMVDWICVSPKEDIRQGSPAAEFHNQNPQDPQLNPDVVKLLAEQEEIRHEYRFVIGGPDAKAPPLLPAFRHYLSPAVLSDGSGEEWKTGFPGFAPGALERCLEIARGDSRWRVSLQTHKFVGAR